MLDDLRIGARTFLRNPGFASLAVVTLALGIAANTAMFSVVNGVLLRPLPFPDPDRVVVVNTPSAARADNSHSAPDFIDLAREQQSFTALAGVRQDLFAVISPTGQAQQFQGAYVTSAFYDVFGMPAEAGRAFTADADTNVGGARVVFSHAAATRLAADVATLVDSTLRVNGVSTRVVGVMPAHFNVPDQTGVGMLSAGQVPPSPLGGETADRELRYFDAVARIRADRTEAQIRGDLDRVADHLNAQRSASVEARR
jgi:hypothetical protein